MGIKRLWHAVLFCSLLSAGWPKGFSPAALLPICAIQGIWFTSPYLGRSVITRGVVTLDQDSAWQQGFYMQAENCDGSPSTSDGLFVYLGERVDVVAPGDLAQVSGLVEEYYGLTELLAAPADVQVLSHANPLPAAVDLNPPLDDQAARLYLEGRESMLAGLASARVVGPTDADDRTWLARADLGIEHVFYDDPGGTGEVICADDGGLYEISPEARTGDLVQNLSGVLDFRYGQYCLQLLAPPVVIPAAGAPLSHGPAAPAHITFSFSLATFNLENLFDTGDDPLTDDSVLSPTEYQRRLQKRARAIHGDLGEPDLLAVQEVETLAVLDDLAGHSEIYTEYVPVFQDGPDRRGLDIALLYRFDRVRLLGYEARQGCTALVDGLGPDGNLDMANPQNALTCDTDGDGLPDGNRLFSRPPLLAHVWACEPGCSLSGARVDLWLIINHWKSKVEDTDTIQYTQTRRIQQAQFVAGLAQEILAAHPDTNLVVLGDLNDYPDSPPLAQLSGLGLVNLSLLTDRSQRYTTIFQGIAQMPDQALARLTPGLVPLSVSPLHINADYPYSLAGQADTALRCSDHDPLLVQLGVADHWLYLPLALR